MQALIAPLKELAEYDEIRKVTRQGKGTVALSGCVDSQKLHMIYGLSDGLKYKVIVTYSCLLYTSAGGYNSNVAKLITGQEEWKAEDVVVYAIGNKGREILERKGYTVKESYPEVIEEPTYAEAMLLSDKLLTSFAAGEIGEIYLAYTHFKNTVSHEPKLLKLLPVEYDAEAGASTEGALSLIHI